MSKVIGARISNEIYEKLDQLSISNTEIIKRALEQYLEMNVNTSEKGVNTVLFENEYQGYPTKGGFDYRCFKQSRAEAMIHMSRRGKYQFKRKILKQTQKNREQIMKNKRLKNEAEKREL